jgi:hypothetical protein
MGGEIRVDGAGVRRLAQDAKDVLGGLRLGPVLDAVQGVARALPAGHLAPALASCADDFRGTLAALVAACEAWEGEVRGALADQLGADADSSASIARMMP